MKALRIVCLFAGLFSAASGYTDRHHYSDIFQAERNFRVFTPPAYDSADSNKKYPVIFYLNGCGGSFSSNYSSYWGDGGYAPPMMPDTGDLDKPYNGEFELYVQTHDVIVVTIDGKIPGLGGCGVYYPFSTDPTWPDSDWAFAKYLPELVGAVDSLYNTYADPQYRAVTGLSMGGHASIWISSVNPQLIRSASHFSHSPPYWRVGTPPLSTPVDVTQLWRNFRGVPFRTSTNTQDYIFHPSREMGVLFRGAGFENDYHKVNFWRHWAADIDSQFDFHMTTFAKPRPPVTCFSLINLYPDFDAWGYHVASGKTDPGWIYLRDVCKNGLGLTTRERLPYGKPLAPFQITVTTPPVYVKNQSYTLVRYGYAGGKFSTSSITADSLGRLSVVSTGGRGEEIGIVGGGLPASVVLLGDTVNETMFLTSGRDTALSFYAVNLSETPLQGVMFYATSETENLTVKSGLRFVDLPAKSKVRIDSLAVVRGNFYEDGDPRYFRDWGFLKVQTYLQGVRQDRESYFQAHIMKKSPEPVADTDVVIFDGRQSWEMPTYNFTYGSYEGVTSKFISEGHGNGDSLPDSGEVVSVWIRLAGGLSPYDSNAWHPTVPMLTGSDTDVSVDSFTEFSWNRVRPLLSAQLRLRRTPTVDDPMVIPVYTELYMREDSPGAHQNNSIDAKVYSYHTVILPPAAAINVERAGGLAKWASLSVAPNPIQTSAKIRLRLGTAARAFPEASIYDVRGKKLRSMDPAAGGFRRTAFEYSWNGLDQSGAPVPSGIYFLRMAAGGRMFIKKLVVTR